MSTPRRKCIEFDVSHLCEALTPFAKLKTPDWGDWELLEYNKKRSCGPDRTALEKYALLLKIVLVICPSGRPSHVRLREAYLFLQRKYNIMSSELAKVNKDVNTWADECVDRVKVALKHLSDIKDSRTTFMTPSVRELVMMITDEEEEPHPEARASGLDRSRAPRAQPPPAPLTNIAPTSPTVLDRPAPESPPPELLSQPGSEASASSSTSSVVIENVVCNCPECIALRGPVEVVASQKSIASGTSEAADAVKWAVPARSRQAKKVLQKKPAAAPVSAGSSTGPSSWVKKRPAAAAAMETRDQQEPANRVVRLIQRRKPPEAYILLNKKYLCGLSRSRNPGYVEILKVLKEEVLAGEITEPVQARARMLTMEMEYYLSHPEAP